MTTETALAWAGAENKCRPALLPFITRGGFRLFPTAHDRDHCCVNCKHESDPPPPDFSCDRFIHNPPRCLLLIQPSGVAGRYFNRPRIVGGNVCYWAHQVSRNKHTYLRN